MLSHNLQSDFSGILSIWIFYRIYDFFDLVQKLILVKLANLIFKIHINPISKLMPQIIKAR